MQGLTEFWQAWMLYIGFSFVGLWCIRRTFFWLKTGSESGKLITVLAAALLLTPAPISGAEGYYAPAIFVLLIEALEGQSLFMSSALLWLLLGACVAGVLLVVDSSIKVFMVKDDAKK